MPSRLYEETPYGMDKKKLKKVANARSKRQKEIEKPGPVTVYDFRDYSKVSPVAPTSDEQQKRAIELMEGAAA